MTPETHKVKLTVEVDMEEMDGSAYESAEIALELVEEAVHGHFGSRAKVSVDSYSDAEGPTDVGIV